MKLGVVVIGKYVEVGSVSFEGYGLILLGVLYVFVDFDDEKKFIEIYLEEVRIKLFVFMIRSLEDNMKSL